MVLQRVIAADLEETQVWEHWFKGYFRVLGQMSPSGLPVYTRFANSTKEWQARLSGDPGLGVQLGGIKLVQDTVCFERAYTSLGIVLRSEAANQFRSLAYIDAGVQEGPRNGPGELHVLLSLRTKEREMTASSVALLLEKLGKMVPSPVVEVLRQPADDFHAHVQIMARSNVVIATHGGFETNAMFQQPGSAYVELRGAYTKGMSAPEMFAQHALNFGIDLEVLTIHGLTSHRQESYVLSAEDILGITQLVASLGAVRPGPGV